MHRKCQATGFLLSELLSEKSFVPKIGTGKMVYFDVCSENRNIEGGLKMSEFTGKKLV
jgi:hypothetical protein